MTWSWKNAYGVPEKSWIFCNQESGNPFNYCVIKTEWWGAGVVICLERGADLHVAQLMPLPLTLSCFSKIQIGTGLEPTHSDGP